MVEGLLYIHTVRILIKGDRCRSYAEMDTFMQYNYVTNIFIQPWINVRNVVCTYTYILKVRTIYMNITYTWCFSWCMVLRRNWRGNLRFAASRRVWSNADFPPPPAGVALANSAFVKMSLTAFLMALRRFSGPLVSWAVSPWHFALKVMPLYVFVAFVEGLWGTGADKMVAVAASSLLIAESKSEILFCRYVSNKIIWISNMCNCRNNYSSYTVSENARSLRKQSYLRVVKSRPVVVVYGLSTSDSRPAGCGSWRKYL